MSADDVVADSNGAGNPTWATQGGPTVERRSGLTPAAFHREYVLQNRPVILTDVLRPWTALGKWTPRFFAEHYGDRTIQFKHDPVKRMKMRDFIALVEASRPGAPAPYWTNNPLQNLFPELLPDIAPLPLHCLPNWATRRYLHRGMQKSLNRGAMVELYIGGAGGSFPLVHWDGQSTHAFLMQVHGRKQYWAWAPDQSPWMYPRTAEGLVNVSNLGDVEHPDFGKFPLFRQARGCQFHLDPGEMLYVPSRWWHTAKMTEPSITLSINTVNRSNWPGFAEDMTRNARGPSLLLKKAYLSAACLLNILSDLASGLPLLFLWVALLVCSSALAPAGGDPQGQENLSGKHLLPEGKGLAARFPRDAGLKGQPEVIFADDFEEGALGEGWDETGNKDGKVLSYSPPGKDTGLGERCLRVEAHLGQDTGGGLTKWFEPSDPVFIRFYTKFDERCDYVHHFVTLRANKGLRGGDKWSGFGGAGLQPEGGERFSTAIEPWGNWGAWTPPGRWNFYSYWHEMEPSKDGKFWGNSFAVPTAPLIPRGAWICVEFMLKHNTPGQPDGEQAFWIDGQLQGHWKGINWRSTEGLKANALSLESYFTDRWTGQAVNVVSFDNVVITKRYIGPVARE